jgi:hypothetical protein
VSEYQYYEFKAMDRALTKAEMAALHAISARAVITSTSFTNHYEWGEDAVILTPENTKGADSDNFIR